MKKVTIVFLVLLACLPLAVFGDECDVSGMEMNVDRPGMDYKDFDVENSCDCADACLMESECKAYTYVRPENRTDVGHCWLKNGIPKPVNDKPCCISGTKSIDAVLKYQDIDILFPPTINPRKLSEITLNSDSKKPEITDTWPKICVGEACSYSILIGGQDFTIIGSDFGLYSGNDLKKVNIMLSKETAQIQDFILPPKAADNLIQNPIIPSSVTGTEIKAIAPTNLDSWAYLWLYIEGVGYSNPFSVYISSNNTP